MEKDALRSKGHSASAYACPSCFTEGMEPFHHVDQVPVNSVLNVRSREQALAFPRGRITLGFCNVCGFVSNMAFDKAMVQYCSDCEESQGYSPTFNKFAHQLARNLVEKYGLMGKDILEIGCGKGEFLRVLCQLGNNRGVGFDPAYIPGRNGDDDSVDIRFVRDYYTEKYTHYKADLICCKMTLEHIYDTGRFIDTVRRSIGDRTDTIVFFQVPDFTRILHDCAFEDIYYEHCSYFTPDSLARLFRLRGFDVLESETVYEGQYITLEAKPISPKTVPKSLENEDLDELKKSVSGFRRHCLDGITFWQDTLRRMGAKGEKVVIWGSGSKGVAFLTTLQVGDAIEYVVDINPHRQGTYMAGTGQLVVAPDYLKSYKPDAVIVMNPVYRDEIQQDLDRMGLHPRILALGNLEK